MGVGGVSVLGDSVFVMRKRNNTTRLLVRRKLRY